MQTTEFACPIGWCPEFPFESQDALTAHLNDHPQANTSGLSRFEAAPVAAVEAAPAAGFRGFGPGGTRAMAPRSSAPVESAPVAPVDCRWTRDYQDNWVIRGPLSVLQGATSVTVVKRDGERKTVEIDPATVRPDVRKRWDTCDMGLAAPAPRKTAAPAVDVTPGRIYATADGTLVNAAESKAGNLYGKVLGADGRRFSEYERGIIGKIVRAISAEEAAAYGHETGSCVFCAHELTHKRSIAVGYGPVCAENNGLPW